MTVDSDDPGSVVDRILNAVERGDGTAVRACYAADAKIWHNFDEAEQTVDENIATLEALVGVLTERKYTLRERFDLPDGIGQHHYLYGVLPDGSKYHLPACMLFKIADGRITRIDEYFDSAHFGPLLIFLPES
jgi:ketosteroid isomerase-like protein